tara:strand:- start:530 stop:799 length:270 start_codon:yes stop_codon:yes gene_type:complete
MVYIIRFKEENKNKVGHKEYRGPHNSSSQRTLLIPKVHKIPGNIISLDQSQYDENPVQDLHSQKIGMGQRLWLCNPQSNFNYGHQSKEC